MEEVFNESFLYPDINDPHLQYKLFIKKEFYDYKIKPLPYYDNFDSILKYQDLKCNKQHWELTPHQIILGNLMNPDTPYKRLLLFHGLGTGKTTAAIVVANNFIKQVQEYNTKIYILVPGPTIKQSWIKEIKNFYEHQKVINNQNINNILQCFKIKGYKSFYRQVFGIKIKEVKIKKNKKKVYQAKDENGNLLFKEVSQKLNNLDNSLLIIDEAHNITGNDTIKAVLEIVKKSYNLRVLLLTATPMKNEANDIIDLLNILKYPEQIDKNKIFSTDGLQLLPTAKDYLLKNTRGLVSYVKNYDQYLFSPRQDIGTSLIPNKNKTFNLIRCQLQSLQKQAYEQYNFDSIGINQKLKESLNFVFPGFDPETKKIIPLEPMKSSKILAYFKNILSSNECENYLNELKRFIKCPENNKEPLIKVKNQNMSGLIFRRPYLDNFSIKFSKALKNINKYCFIHNKNSDKNKFISPIFIYSNFVFYGINLFKFILLENGYIEYGQTPDSNTLCYYCGEPFESHNTHNNVTSHRYYPATFISITGKDSDSEEDNQEENRKIIENIFNNPNNYDGRYIKIVLGSKVLSEGYNLLNVTNVHILDAWYNLTKLNQVIGRAIRMCSHYVLTSLTHSQPIVSVFKYTTVLTKQRTNNLSLEEKLYLNAIKKDELIKEIENVLIKNAIDCPLNQLYSEKNGQKGLSNSENNEVGKCIDPQLKQFEIKKSTQNENIHYYDIPDKKIIQLTTYNKNNMQNEILKYSKIIKILFAVQMVYEINEIIQKFNEFLKNEQVNEFFIYKALDLFIPKTELDYASFDNFLIDKFNRAGYLIYVNGFYIFQEIGKPENLNIENRFYYPEKRNDILTLNEYLSSKNIDQQEKKDVYIYNMDYYQSHKEFKYVGCIAKETNRKNYKSLQDLKDVFKLKIKNTDKTVTFLGSVCFNSYEFETLKNVYLDLKPKAKISNNSRVCLCDEIQKILMLKEKFRDNNEVSMIIPENHPTLPFPYNVNDLIDTITKEYNIKNVNLTANVKYPDSETVVISIADNQYITENPEPLLKRHFVHSKNKWELKY